jgi:prepilin-type N-terminal cleavage/methylation domain-containing protein
MKTNKKKGFAMVEVMIAMAITSAALMTFFVYINHLFKMTSKSVDISNSIENRIIFFSDLGLEYKFKNNGEINKENFQIKKNETKNKAFNSCKKIKEIELNNKNIQFLYFHKKEKKK